MGVVAWVVYQIYLDWSVDLPLQVVELFTSFISQAEMMHSAMEYGYKGVN